LLDSERRWAGSRLACTRVVGGEEAIDGGGGHGRVLDPTAESRCLTDWRRRAGESSGDRISEAVVDEYRLVARFGVSPSSLRACVAPMGRRWGLSEHHDRAADEEARAGGVAWT
jgi:hypothetical protein